jgi:ribosome-associated protein
MPKPSRPSLNHADTSRASDDSSRAFAVEAAQLLHDDKCEDVLVLDLRGQSQITDYFVIGTGTSQRQMRSAGMHVEKLAQEQGIGVFSTNLGERDTSWFILDIAGSIVHLFESHTRGFYDLEMLWGDAERVDWRRPDQREADQLFDDPARNRAGLRSADLPGRRAGFPVDGDAEGD